MKMKIKVSIFAVFTLFFSLLLSFSAFAQTDKFIDKADKFSADEVALFEQKLDDASRDGRCDFYIYVYANNSPDDNVWGEKVLDELGLSEYDDIVLLTLKYELDEWYCDIYTYGSAYDYITDSEVDYLCEDGGIFDYIKAIDAHEGILDYIDFASRATKGNAIPIAKRIWVPIFLAAVGALVAFIWVVVSYKRKVRSDTYPLKEFTEMNLTYSRDDFAGSFVTRRRVPRSNGSSRSGGGGGGRGGGGGHRGGR